MKTYTKAEILKFAQELWACDSYEQPEFDVLVYTDEQRVDITVSRMYESVDLNLDILTKLADFFGTKNINDDERFSNMGCETCDYGSSYGFTLTVRPD